MAPELLDQFIDEDSIPDLSKADIFSLGASIYELMIGKFFLINKNNFVIRRRAGEEWVEVAGDQVRNRASVQVFQFKFFRELEKFDQEDDGQKSIESPECGGYPEWVSPHWTGIGT